VLLEVAHASSAQHAARLARLLGFIVSPDTLIRLQRAEVLDPVVSSAVAIDEFALRRGCTYGTLVVDLLHHQPVALLDGIQAEAVRAWLAAHTQIAVLARDRAGAYARAARDALPQAVQVADRFHLVRNVHDAFRQVLRGHRWRMPDDHEPATPSPEPADADGTEDTQPDQAASQRLAHPPTPLKQARWEAVQERHRQGLSIRAIARALRMERRTVRKYLAAATPPGYALRDPRPTKLSPYLPYLRRRWEQGCHNGLQLHRELLELGFQGSLGTVYRALGRRRGRPQRAPPRRAPSLHRLLRRSPQHLTPEEREQVEAVLAANPHLADAYRLRQRFRDVVATRDLEGMDAWIVAAQRSLSSEFRTLAKGFRQDWQAILAALATPWSTSPCEGQNTRVKLIKRLGYGRANIDLLRQRVLHRFPAVS
jgi:transposase